ncbi:hypothetical protein [uncultured Microbulbifer sp.]|uniref:hypothetical protein n=1 Tax=uncultured Microbulbifer sp. TaxID=348147 RepID=UPI00260FB09C|nr:hypothetical protein [uncultured Microbulbifer sp.]
MSIDFPFLFYRYKVWLETFIHLVPPNDSAVIHFYDSAVILKIDNTQNEKKKLQGSGEIIWDFYSFLPPEPVYCDRRERKHAETRQTAGQKLYNPHG